jgi:hypothetical protein
MQDYLQREPEAFFGMLDIVYYVRKTGSSRVASVNSDGYLYFLLGAEGPPATRRRISTRRYNGGPSVRRAL